MRRRRLLAVVLAVLSGCAAARERPRTSAAPIEEDPAITLAAMLPSSAERCLVARPGRLADRHRSLVVHATEADVLAFSSSPRTLAYATASATGRDGRTARVTLVRLAEDVGAARELLRDALPLRVRFDDEACEADECQLPVAEILDARTIRIARGPRPSDVGGSPCVDLAIAHPDAIEVSVEDGSCGADAPCSERRIVTAGAEGLRVRQQLTMPDEARAEELAEAFDRVGPELPGTRVERRGSIVVRISEQSWDDLLLRLEDERIERAALARRAAARQPTPMDRIDVTRLAVVRQQIRLREEQLVRARGTDRRRWTAEELATLLARALEAHPDEPDLAARLARVRLDELGDPEGACAAIDPFVAESPEDARFALLLRECRVAASGAAPSDEAALARAAGSLVAAALAPDDATARAMVRDLAAILGAGVPYELAEGTLVQAREATSRATPLVPIARGAGLPLSSLPATFAWLAELDGARGPYSVSVAVRGVPSDGIRALRADRMDDAVVMRFDALGGSVFAGTGGDPAALLRIGASLSALVGGGEVTIDVVLASFSGPTLAHARLAGTLANGRVRIERADATSASRSWARIERYLAEPLRTLGTRTFPAPDLVVIAADDADALRLARIGDGAEGARCSARGVEIRCAPGEAAPPIGALRAIARAALAAAPAGD